MTTAKAGSAGASILVIDDEGGVRDFLGSQLAKRGFAVRCVPDGERALAALRVERFQLAMCDLNMPRMDGLEVLGQLKRADPDLAVILATGYATVENAVEAMKLGACEVLQKPFDIDQLHTAVEKALEKGRLVAELALYEASRALFGKLNAAELLPVLAELSARLLEAEGAAVLLVGPDGLSLAARHGLPEEACAAPPAGLLEQARRWRDVVAVPGPFHSDPLFTGLPSHSGALHSLVCPLRSRSELLGVLCALRERPQAFGPLDFRRAAILAQETALALDNARLYGELERRTAAAEEARRRLEESQAQLVQSEKMSAIGLITGGLAHEIANPLTAMVVGLEVIAARVAGDTVATDVLERSRRQARRISSIVGDLLDYARPSAFEPRPVSLAEVAKESASFLAHELSARRVELIEEHEDGAPAVMADPKCLQQVFVNLILNAAHAMEQSPRRRLTLRTRRAGDGGEAEVEDTGHGIAEQDLPRLFTPFFTTKPPGHGTGLGLYVVQGIVRRHGGELTVSSRAGEGTTFLLRLPARAEAA